MVLNTRREDNDDDGGGGGGSLVTVVTDCAVIRRVFFGRPVAVVAYAFTSGHIEPVNTSCVYSDDDRSPRQGRVNARVYLRTWSVVRASNTGDDYRRRRRAATPLWVVVSSLSYPTHRDRDGDGDETCEGRVARVPIENGGVGGDDDDDKVPF